MAKTTFKYGNTGLTMTSDLEGYFRRLFAEVKTESIGTILETCEKIATEAEAKTPVKSGALRASIGTHVTFSEDSVKVGIHSGTSEVDYVYLVKYGKNGPGTPGKSVWQETIGKPLRAAVKTIVKDLAHRIDVKAKAG